MFTCIESITTAIQHATVLRSFCQDKLSGPVPERPDNTLTHAIIRLLISLFHFRRTRSSFFSSPCCTSFQVILLVGLTQPHNPCTSSHTDCSYSVTSSPITLQYCHDILVLASLSIPHMVTSQSVSRPPSGSVEW